MNRRASMLAGAATSAATAAVMAAIVVGQGVFSARPAAQTSAQAPAPIVERQTIYYTTYVPAPQVQAAVSAAGADQSPSLPPAARAESESAAAPPQPTASRTGEDSGRSSKASSGDLVATVRTQGRNDEK